MPNIYVTYRSGDSSSDEAKLFIHILKKTFKNDRVTLTDANRNADVLEVSKKIREHDVLIVLIGKRFFNIVDEHGHPELWDAYDYLHAEVFAALETPLVRVICVLTDGARMPSDDFFPKNLKALAKKRIITIKHIKYVPEAVNHIAELLKKAYHSPKYKPSKRLLPNDSNGSRRNIIYAFLALLIVVIFGVSTVIISQNDTMYKQATEELATLNAVATQSAFIRSTANALAMTANAPSSSYDLILPETPIVSETPIVLENQIVDERGVSMVRVPTGCFLMGSDDGELDEQPKHQICIIEDFWIDQYEVTNNQFETLGGRAGGLPDWSDPMQPRTSVTWLEAQNFCILRGGRLPTEAEWEYAARGVNNLTYPWGNAFSADYVVYASNSDNEPSIIGSYPRGVSWVGAYDMSGNVREWVSSSYEDYPYNASDGREDLDNLSPLRILRGGSFSNTRYALSSTDRFKLHPDTRNSSFGFRCVVSKPLQD